MLLFIYYFAFNEVGQFLSLKYLLFCYFIEDLNMEECYHADSAMHGFEEKQLKAEINSSPMKFVLFAFSNATATYVTVFVY